MIQTSAEVKNLFTAFHKAQADLKTVHKDATNPFFKSKYATLESVVDAAKPSLTANGLSFTQAPGELQENAITVSTMIMHVSGEWMRSDFQMPLAKKDPQGTGAAISYACRYALMAVLGLPATDDDAESSVDRNDKKKETINTSIIDSARVAAKGGNSSLDDFLKLSNKEKKEALKPYALELRKIADDADAMA